MIWKEGGSLKSNPGIGNRIKQIRLKNGKSQEDFGSLFEPPVNKTSVSRWESGKTLPTSKRLQKIAELGGVSVKYLIDGSQLSVANLKKLAEKIKKEDQLTSEEITKANEALLDAKIFGKTLFDSTNQKATVKLKKQQQIIDEHPLNPFDRDLYADFVALFNLLRLTGSEQQYISFSTLINFMFRIANGNMEYDKEDILPNIDKLLSSFPIKKENKKD